MRGLSILVVGIAIGASIAILLSARDELDTEAGTSDVSGGAEDA